MHNMHTRKKVRRRGEADKEVTERKMTTMREATDKKGRKAQGCVGRLGGGVDTDI